MSNPTTRIMALLELLQSRGHSSGRELARELGVDGRTLRRYIAALEEMGIPITAERGRDGGYRLVAGFRLPPMVFTEEETLAISLGLLAARSLGALDLSPAIASAEAKLDRVMPRSLKHRLGTLSDTMTLDLAPANATDGGTLSTLTAATHDSRRIGFHYLSGSDGPGQRQLDPYGLVYRRGHWYAVGHCHLRGALRSFRLDRMRQLRPLEQKFQRPEAFNAAEYIRRSFRNINGGEAVEILLHTDLAAASTEVSGHYGLLTPQRDAVLWRLYTGDLPQFARYLALLPFSFEILTPDALKQTLRNQAERLLSMA